MSYHSEILIGGNALRIYLFIYLFFWIVFPKHFKLIDQG